MSEPNFYGIRHHSPSGAYFVRKFLEEKRPKLVLIEEICDHTELASDMIRAETEPPFAVLDLIHTEPLRSYTTPFTEYSPEYQAMLWCGKNSVPFRFIDLPASAFAYLDKEFEIPKTDDEQSGENAEELSVYGRLSEICGGVNTFRERTLEHCADTDAYRSGEICFGEQLRAASDKSEQDEKLTKARESFMKARIREAVNSGTEPGDIVVITGSYHVEGLKNWREEEALPEFPQIECTHTLMPYSYYRISSRSGYRSGLEAPAYCELLWEGLNLNDPEYSSFKYLTKIAKYMRNAGYQASSAQVIEAVRLAGALAELRGGSAPVLEDLRDAAQTCFGEGSFAAISTAAADTEIGTAVGALPAGVGRTLIQDDFYDRLKQLKLDKYRTVTAQDLKLDLRENRRASSERSAFLDLERSFFLHRLCVIGTHFAEKQAVTQDGATWAENWILRWTPESEIELVEAALKGDSVKDAASFIIKDRVENANNMSEISAAIEDAFFCGISELVSYAAVGLQKISVNAASFDDIAKTAFRLSNVISYGDLRKIKCELLSVVLEQLHLRACLILANDCSCNDEAANALSEAINMINSVTLAQDFLQDERWITALKELAYRDDLNTRLSGLAAAILLERSQMSGEELKTEVSRRLSKGVPADLGAGWFEGLTMKNRYALIARLSLWESLDEYINSLDDEEFKRALVFLRRAFADFSAGEKDSIAENLGEIWGLNGAEVSEIVNAQLDTASQEQIAALDDFDFDI